VEIQAHGGDPLPKVWSEGALNIDFNWFVFESMTGEFVRSNEKRVELLICWFIILDSSIG
jgi:hypothetical protein